MDPPIDAENKEKPTDGADKKNSGSDNASETAAKSIPSSSIPTVKPPTAEFSLSEPVSAPSTAPVDPYAFPQDDIQDKSPLEKTSSKLPLPAATTTPSDVRKTSDDTMEELTVHSPKPTTSKPAHLTTLSQIKLTEDFERVTTPLGSPLTPDVGDIFQPSLVKSLEGSPLSVEGKPKKPRPSKASAEGSTPESATKRKSSRELPAPGSPLSIVSERQQLALLRKEALESEKRSSPDTSFPRPDRSSTPSSTSSAKESREARSVNRRDGKGETPLHIASKKGDLEAVKKLVEDGADVNAADNAGWTPLHEAANHGREDVCKFLISAGADINVKGMDDVTPLMDAVSNGHVNIAKELLTAGANPLAENNRGENSLKLAEGATKNQSELNDLLRSHIGPPPVPASPSTSASKVQEIPLKKKDKMSTPGKETPSPKKRPRQISESDSGKKVEKDTKKKLAESGGKEPGVKRPTSIEKKKKDKPSEPKEKEMPEEKKGGPKEDATVSASLPSKNSSTGMPAVFVGRNTLVLKPAEPVVEKEKAKEKATSQYEDISDDEEAKPTEAPSLTPTQSTTTTQSSQALSAVNPSGVAPSLISPSVKESVPTAVVSSQPSIQPSIPKPSFSAAKTSVEVGPSKKEVPILSSTVQGKVDTVGELVKASSAKMSEEKMSDAKMSTEGKGKGETVDLSNVDVPTKEASAVPPTESTLLVPSSSSDTRKAPEVTAMTKISNVSENVVGGMKEPVKSDAIDQKTDKEKIDLPAKDVPPVKQPALPVPIPATPIPSVTTETPKPDASTDVVEKKPEKVDVLPSTPSAPPAMPVPPISSTTPAAKPEITTPVPPPVTPAVPRPQAQASLPAPPPTHTINTTPITEKPADVTAATHQVPTPIQSQPTIPPQTTSLTEKPTLHSTTQVLKDTTAPSPNLSAVLSSTPTVPPVSAASTTTSPSTSISSVSQSTDTVLPSLPSSTSALSLTSSSSAPVPVGSVGSTGGSAVTTVVPSGVTTTVHPSPVVTTSGTVSTLNTPTVSGARSKNSSDDPDSITALIVAAVNRLDGAPVISSSIRSSGPLPPLPQSSGPVTPVVRGGGPMTSIVRMPNVPTSGFVSAMSTSGTKVLFGVSTEKKQDKKVEKVKNKEVKEKESEKGKEKKKKVKEGKEGKMTGENTENAGESQAGVSSSHRPDSEDEVKVKPDVPAGKKRGESTTKKERPEKPEKRLTRAQRAAAAAASGQPITPARRRNAKDDKDKPTRGRGKRAAAELDVPPGAVIDTAEQKQKRPRASPKKQLAMEAAAKSPTKKDEPVVAKEAPPQPESPTKSLGTPMDISVGSSSSEPVNRLPFKKRLTIRNEIEEFINQRRQVEENWKKYTNTFAMKVFPKNCNDYLILRKNYSIDSSMPPKRDAPPVLPLGLKTCFDEQEEERRTLMRSHLMERDRLIMGAEQEMWRLHQRFSRISAGIPIPFSACMIMSEQESNRSFQSQEQEDRAKVAPAKPRMSMRDLIKWLEESDDKFDSAKTEMLTRQRLEAQMLHSKQRMYWAWRQEDLGMHDPSCRNPEDLHNPYVPQVVVEDFVMLPDA